MPPSGGRSKRLAHDLARRDGCLPVYSPVLGRAQPHSHRELPIRLHEVAAMFRAERSGVLSGLNRVRQINLDDTHVFCRPDQIAEEVARGLRSAVEAQRIRGLPIDYVRVSRRGPGGGYLGEAEQWAQAEDALRAAAPDAVDAADEAAFYGPKLDLQVGEDIIAAVQLDFVEPERFDLTYAATDGTRQRVVMIHRGTVGSMERVVAAVLERYDSRLPLWLAPVPGRCAAGRAGAGRRGASVAGRRGAGDRRGRRLPRRHHARRARQRGGRVAGSVAASTARPYRYQ